MFVSVFECVRVRACVRARECVIYEPGRPSLPSPPSTPISSHPPAASISRRGPAECRSPPRASAAPPRRWGLQVIAKGRSRPPPPVVPLLHRWGPPSPGPAGLARMVAMGVGRGLPAVRSRDRWRWHPLLHRGMESPSTHAANGTVLPRRAARRRQSTERLHGSAACEGCVGWRGSRWSPKILQFRPKPTPLRRSTSLRPLRRSDPTPVGRPQRFTRATRKSSATTHTRTVLYMTGPLGLWSRRRRRRRLQRRWWRRRRRRRRRRRPPRWCRARGARRH